MTNYIKSKRDLIKQNYLPSTTNHVICIDITELGPNGHLFLGIDLGARLVIMNCVKTQPLSVSDIIETFKLAFKHRAFLPKINIIHSREKDRTTIFRNVTFQQFVEQQGIELSRASSKAHSNTVIELFRSLKDIMRKKYDPNWKVQTSGELKKNDPIRDMSSNI